MALHELSRLTVGTGGVGRIGDEEQLGVIRRVMDEGDVWMHCANYGEGAFRAMVEWASWARLALETFGGGSPLELSVTGIGLAVAAGAAVVVTAGALGASAIVAVATRSLLRSRL